MTRQTERSAVIVLHNAGKTNCEILRELGWTRSRESFVRKTIQRFQETNSIVDRSRTGRPRSARTPQLLRNIAHRIRRNPRRSQRHMARSFGVSTSTITRALRDDLGLRAYRLRKSQLLSASARLKRLALCKKLQLRFTPEKVRKSIFCDEKHFTVETLYNSQNTRAYAVRLSDIPLHQRTISRVQKPGSVLVWAAVSFEGKLPLHFVPKGVTIDRFYYRDRVLQNVLLPEAQNLYPHRDWTFIQDGAPPHTARTTQEWCSANLPDFVKKDCWPPYSPDLNPLDYTIWSALEAKVNEVSHSSIEHLRRAIEREWNKLSMDTVRNSITSWKDRLQKCIRARGGHFEQ